jgi:uncharacterized membrane protein YbhN (UPF0104 family)
MASVSLAVVGGFLSGIPGGAVVREGILCWVLAREVTEATALAAAVVLRLVWLASELVISAVLYIMVRRPVAVALQVTVGIGLLNARYVQACA